MTRIVLTVAVALLILLAGCTGGGGGDGGATTTTQQTTAVGDGGGDGGGDGDGGGATPGEFNHFDFEEGERYEYEVFMEGQGEGTFVWEVTSASGDQVTVHTVYDVGGTRYESTVSGSKSSIRSQVMQSPAGGFMSLALFSPYYGYYQQGELRVGNQWSYSSPEGSLSFQVTEKTSYAGVECFATEMRHNTTVINEGCFSPELGLAPYTAYYTEDGQKTLEMRLVDYESGG